MAERPRGLQQVMSRRESLKWLGGIGAAGGFSIMGWGVFDSLTDDRAQKAARRVEKGFPRPPKTELKASTKTVEDFRKQINKLLETGDVGKIAELASMEGLQESQSIVAQEQAYLDRYHALLNTRQSQLKTLGTFGKLLGGALIGVIGFMVPLLQQIEKTKSVRRSPTPEVEGH